jgi:hypothetical protein
VTIVNNNRGLDAAKSSNVRTTQSNHSPSSKDASILTPIDIGFLIRRFLWLSIAFVAIGYSLHRRRIREQQQDFDLNLDLGHHHETHTWDNRPTVCL